jgi:hypothetical protein
MWRSDKEDIKQWMDSKEYEFARDHNKNPQISSKQWLHRYVFTDLQKTFFADFPIFLA